MVSTLIRLLFYSALLTLPWVGVGMINFFTGHDVGGGMQPSWFFLALALGFLFLKSSRNLHPGNWVGSLAHRHPALLSVTLLSLLAVLISGLGIFIAPSMEIVSTSWIRLLKQLIQLLIMFAFLWWAVLWVNSRERWQLVLNFLFLGAAFQILYSFFQGLEFFFSWSWFSSLETFFTSNPSILSGSEKLYINNVMQEIPRLRGTVCEPLYLGNYLLMVWPFLLVWRRNLPVRLLLGGGLFLLLVFTWSRGSWIGFACQLIFLALVHLLKKRPGPRGESKNGSNWAVKRLPVILPLLTAILILVDFQAGGWISRRMMASFNNQDWSNLTRLYSMKAAWLAFLQSPVVGIGWGQFAFHFPLLVSPMGLQSQFTWPVVNNFPLQILCETGLLGFTLLVGFGAFLVRKTQKILQKKAGLDRSDMVLTAAFVSALGVWIQLLSFSQYNLPHIWFGAGLLLSALQAGQVVPAQKSEKESS